MGPFAIGDALFASTVPAIMGGLLQVLHYKEINRNLPMGISNFAINVFRWKQLEFAHKQGVTLVTTMKINYLL